MMWHVRRHCRDYRIQIPRGPHVAQRLVHVDVVQYSPFPAKATVVRLLIAVAGITCMAVWPGWGAEDVPWIVKLIAVTACAGWAFVFYRVLRGRRKVAKQWTVPPQWQDLPETVLMKAADSGARVQSLESRLRTLKYGRHFTGMEAVLLQRQEQDEALRRSVEDQLERAREDLIVAVETAQLDLDLEDR